MDFRAWWPVWLQWTVLGLLLLVIGLGLWVRFSLQVVAIDGTEECGACHIMKPYVADLKRSGHAGEANCGDCHVPHNSLAQNGMYRVQQGVKNVASLYQLHAQGKLADFKPQASAATKCIIVENCYRCHDEIADNLNSGILDMGTQGTPQVIADKLPEQGTINCLECHTGLVHDKSYHTPSEEKQPRLDEDWPH